MASFFTVPADWEFSKSEEYETEHPGSAVHFGLRKSARKENLGAYLYRYPGDWSFDQIEKQAARGKGGALDYELGQAPSSEMIVSVFERVSVPVSRAYPQGFEMKPIPGATVSAAAVRGWEFEASQMTSKDGLAVFTLPIPLGTPVMVTVAKTGYVTQQSSQTTTQSKAGVPHFMYTLTPVVPGDDASAGSSGTSMDPGLGTILGIGILIAGIGFLGYRLYKGAKTKKKSVPVLQPV